MPADLVWTRTAPTEPGWYWLRPWWSGPGPDPELNEIREVERASPLSVYVWFAKDGVVRYYGAPDAIGWDEIEWSGPVPLPKEAP